jgi:hypothetical protein
MQIDDITNYGQASWNPSVTIEGFCVIRRPQPLPVGQGGRKERLSQYDGAKHFGYEATDNFSPWEAGFFSSKTTSCYFRETRERCLFLLVVPERFCSYLQVGISVRQSSGTSTHSSTSRWNQTEARWIHWSEGLWVFRDRYFVFGNRRSIMIQLFAMMNLVTVLECQSLGFIHYMYGGHEPFRFFFSLSAYTRFRMKHMDFDLG